MTKITVPFFRPFLNEEEVNEVVETLRSGWLTSGPRVSRFEAEFAAALDSEKRSNGNGNKDKSRNGNGAKLQCIALNSGTAALHLAVEALGLKPGQGVLVPTMTFAATAEVVRYQGAVPILVDVDPVTLNMDLADAERRHAGFRKRFKGRGSQPRDVAGIMPVHVGGRLMDFDQLEQFARRHKLWIVEDSAHAFPAAWRSGPAAHWRHRTHGTKTISCYSFYANKTITTGEGGMAVTSSRQLARRMRLMSLHGLSADAWGRYAANGNWDYKIVAPGFKYNLTDIAAAIGIHQLARAEAMRAEREQIAARYIQALADVEQLELPARDPDCVDSWHLFPVKLHLRRLQIDRNSFMAELKQAGVGCSVHWRPLHLHPYYQKTFGVGAKDFPVATSQWKRLVSLPIFPGMRDDEIDHVISVVRRVCTRNAR